MSLIQAINSLPETERLEALRDAALREESKATIAAMYADADRTWAAFRALTPENSTYEQRSEALRAHRASMTEPQPTEEPQE